MSKIAQPISDTAVRELLHFIDGRQRTFLRQAEGWPIADVETLRAWSTQSEDQKTSNMSACNIAYDRVIRFMAQPQVMDFNGSASLFWAAGAGFSATVQALLDVPNIGVNQLNNFQSAALHVAISEGRTEIVRLLLAHPETDVNIADNRGNTPLALARSWGLDAIVGLLLAPRRIMNPATTASFTVSYAAGSGSRVLPLPQNEQNRPRP